MFRIRGIPPPHKCHCEFMMTNVATITILPEYGVLCGNITEVGVVEDHLSPKVASDLSSPHFSSMTGIFSLLYDSQK